MSPNARGRWGKGGGGCEEKVVKKQKIYLSETLIIEKRGEKVE